MTESDRHRETEEIGPIGWPRKTGPYEVILRYEWLEGRWECVGVDVRALPRAKGPPRLVTSSILRSIPMGKLIEKKRPVRRVARATTLEIQDAVHGHTADNVILEIQPGHIAFKGQEVTITTTTGIRRRGGRPPKYDLRHWQVVAQVYREGNVQRNRKPTRYVARHFKVTESAAAKWVAKCRDLGLLPKTTRGKARAGDAVATPATVRAVASVPGPTVIATSGKGRAVKAKRNRGKR